MNDTTVVRLGDADLRTWSGGRRCLGEGCGAWSIRSPDLLSYAIGHHVWSCARGHRFTEASAEAGGCAAVLQSRPADSSSHPSPLRTPPPTGAFASAGQAVAQDADLDLIEFLHVAVETWTALMGAAGGVVRLADASDRLRRIASSVENADLRELSDRSAEAGPDLLCFTTTWEVAVTDLGKLRAKWPGLHQAMGGQDIHALHSTPLRAHGTAVGTFTLFFTEPGELTAQAATALQALTDDAMFATARNQLTRSVQWNFHGTLDPHPTTERAKGILMALHGITAEVAHARMSEYAVAQGTTISIIVREVLARTLELPLPGHWSSLSSIPPSYPGPGVLMGHRPPGQGTASPALDGVIAELLEQAAETHAAGGRAALARTHRTAAASIRRTTGSAAPAPAPAPGAGPCRTVGGSSDRFSDRRVT